MQSKVNKFWKKINAEGEVANDSKLYFKELQVFAAPGIHPATLNCIEKFLKPGARILELGAGTGAFSYRLKEKNFQVTASGIDQDIFLLDDVPYYFLDLNKELSKKDYEYDAIVATEVIEHLENIFDFFRKIYSILNTGGYAFITTPNILSIRDRLIFLHSGIFSIFSPFQVCAIGHIQINPPWLLRIAAEKAGLRCIDLRGIAYFREDMIPYWQKCITTIMFIFKKIFYKEQFPGEFSSSTILMVLKKIN